MTGITLRSRESLIHDLSKALIKNESLRSELRLMTKIALDRGEEIETLQSEIYELKDWGDQ